MLSLNLKPILKARGIENPYSFLVKSGFTSFTAHNLLNSKTVTFRLAHVEKLCTILNCTPNDLLIWKANPNEKLADSHPLTQLKKQNVNLNWQDTIKTIPLDQLQQIVSIINNHKTRKKQ
jgi:DNA-binding Xre family transcriptional regulator